jgi:hypothetical protein
MNGKVWTSREMAERLAPTNSGDEQALAMRRIQHWTAEELLDPIEVRHSGRGTVRRFSRDALLDAALLWEMSERNMSITSMRYARAIIGFERSDREPDPFEVALRGERRVLILCDLESIRNGRPVIVLDPGEPIVPEDWRVGLWIDLTVTFARLRPHLGEPD